jgi:hypothetical protein
MIHLLSDVVLRVGVEGVSLTTLLAFSLQSTPNLRYKITFKISLHTILSVS